MISPPIRGKKAKELQCLVQSLDESVPSTSGAGQEYSKEPQMTPFGVEWPSFFPLLDPFGTSSPLFNGGRKGLMTSATTEKGHRERPPLGLGGPLGLRHVAVGRSRRLPFAGTSKPETPAATSVKCRRTRKWCISSTWPSSVSANDPVNDLDEVALMNDVALKCPRCASSATGSTTFRPAARCNSSASCPRPCNIPASSLGESTTFVTRKKEPKGAKMMLSSLARYHNGQTVAFSARHATHYEAVSGDTSQVIDIAGINPIMT